MITAADLALALHIFQRKKIVISNKKKKEKSPETLCKALCIIEKIIYFSKYKTTRPYVPYRPDEKYVFLRTNKLNNRDDAFKYLTLFRHQLPCITIGII